MFEVEREQLRNQIKEMVNRHWASTQRALLLSHMGGPIKRGFPNAASIMQVSLREFLRSCPGVQLVEHPHIREKIGAVPFGAKIPENVAEVFAESGSGGSGGHGSSGPYYFPAFWRAFFTPINDKRFVIPATSTHPLRIVDGETPEGEQAYEILESDLSLLPQEAPMFERVRSVSVKIKDWLARNGLSDQPFRDRPYDPKAGSQPGVARPTPTLTEALADLHPSEQARISIPLDIVIRMLSARK
jgi:hypothetical protein